MRRYPSSWSKTLAVLGFRRVYRRRKERIRPRTFEWLEARQMLSATPTDETLVVMGPLPIEATSATTVIDTTDVSTRANSFILPAVDKSTLVYAFAPDATGLLPAGYTVETTHTLDGTPAATIRRAGLDASAPGEVETLLLELRTNNRVFERYEVKVVIASESFIGNLQDARLEAASTQVVSENIASVDAAEASLGELSSALVVTQSRGQSPSSSSRSSVYDDFSQRLDESLASAASDQKVQVAKTLSKSVALLAPTLVEDLASSDQTLAESASRLRDQLLETFGPETTAFAGLGRNQQISTLDVDKTGNEFALMVVEETSVNLIGGIRLELGDQPGLAQARRLPPTSFTSPQLAPLVSTTTGPLADGGVNSASPTSVSGGSSTSLVVGAGSGPTYTNSFLRFDLSNQVGRTLEGATLALNVLTTDGLANTISAYKDIFGVLDSSGPTGVWNDDDLSWNSASSKFTKGFSSVLDTQTPSISAPVEFDVSAAVERAAQIGDSNFNGAIDAGDVNAFYLAIRDSSSYSSGYYAQYGSQGTSTSSFAIDVLNHNDIDWSGALTSADVGPMFARWGRARGDFDLSDWVDIDDYVVLLNNFGATSITASSGGYGRGDLDFDGDVDLDDYVEFYSEYHDPDGAGSVAPKSPVLTFQIAQQNVHVTGSTSYASHEYSSTDAPELTVSSRLYEFTVNSEEDDGDAVSDDDSADSSSVDGEQLTLRSVLDRIGELQESSTTRGQYVIKFASTIHYIPLSDTLEIPSGQVTIEGPGSSQLTINASTISASVKRAFSIGSTASVTLKGLKITGGYVPAGEVGAGVRSYGNLTLDNVKMSGNLVGEGSTSNGGAIYSSGGSLRLLDSIISDNVAKYGGAVDVTLGADDILEVRNTAIRRNSTYAGGVGGGIYLRANLGSAVDIVGSDLEDNLAGYQGGGLFVQWGEVRIADTVFEGNIAGSDGHQGIGGVESGYGGAIYALGTGVLKMTRVSVVDNKVLGLLGVAAGIFATKSVRLESSTIDGNQNKSTLWGEGGGLLINAPSDESFSATGTTISNNRADAGSGAYFALGTPILENSTVSGNSSRGYGGLVIRYSGATLQLFNTTVVENGGGVYLSESGTVITNNSIIAGNGVWNFYGTINTSASHNNFVGATGDGGLAGGTQGNIRDSGIGDPKLLPLDNYGGLVKTHLPKPDSRVINAGSSSYVSTGLDHDGRGAHFPRTLGTVDLGAVEANVAWSSTATSYHVYGTRLTDRITISADAVVIDSIKKSVAVSLPAASTLVVDAGDGDDVVELKENVSTEAAVDGGAGTDQLLGLIVGDDVDDGDSDPDYPVVFRVAPVSVAAYAQTGVAITTIDAVDSDGDQLGYAIAGVKINGVARTPSEAATLVSISSLTGQISVANGSALIPGEYEITVNTIDDSSGHLTSTIVVPLNVLANLKAPYVDLNGLKAGANAQKYLVLPETEIALVGDDVNISDLDGDYLDSLLIRFAFRPDGEDESLDITDAGSLTVSYIASSGILTLTSSSGPASLSAYEDALATLVYANDAEDPTPGLRAIQIVAIDTSHQQSNVAAVQLHILAPAEDADVWFVEGSQNGVDSAGQPVDVRFTDFATITTAEVENLWVVAAPYGYAQWTWGWELLDDDDDGDGDYGYGAFAYSFEKTSGYLGRDDRYDGLYVNTGSDDDELTLADDWNARDDEWFGTDISSTIQTGLGVGSPFIYSFQTNQLVTWPPSPNYVGLDYYLGGPEPFGGLGWVGWRHLEVPLPSIEITEEAQVALRHDVVPSWSISPTDGRNEGVTNLRYGRPSEPAEVLGTSIVTSGSVLHVSGRLKEPNHAPEFVDFPETAPTATGGLSYALPLYVADSDADDQLKVSIDSIEWPDGVVLKDNPFQIKQILANGDRVDGPSGQLDTIGGELTWNPPASLLGKTVTVHVSVSDGDLKTSRAISITVANDINQGPRITSEPSSSFTVPPNLVPYDNPDHVTPKYINLALSPGATETQTISLDISNAEATADIVFVVDNSGSMRDAQQWIGTVIDKIDEQLISLGIENNRFGLVIFAGYSPTTDWGPQILDPSLAVSNPHDALFVSASSSRSAGQRFRDAAEGIFSPQGDDEDGYTGLSMALDPDAYEFRPEAAVNLVLITDDVALDYDEAFRKSLLGSLLGTDIHGEPRYDAAPSDRISVTSIVNGLDFGVGLGKENTVGFSGDPEDWSSDIDSYNVHATDQNQPTFSIATIEPRSFFDVFSTDANIGVIKSEFSIDSTLSNNGQVYLVFNYVNGTYNCLIADIASNKWQLGRYDLEGLHIDAEFDATGLGILPDNSVELRCVAIPSDGSDDLRLDVTVNGSYLGSHVYVDASLHGLYEPDQGVGVGALGCSVSFGSLEVATKNVAVIPVAGKPTPEDPTFRVWMKVDFGTSGSTSMTSPVLGVNLPYSAIGADAHGHAEQLPNPSVYAYPDIERDYLYLSEHTGGSIWDINVLRQGIHAVDEKVLSAFSEGFAQSLAQTALRQLLPGKVTSSDPTVISIEPSYAADKVQFKVTFVGDGQSHSFDLTVKSLDDVEIARVPVSISGAYSHDFVAEDAEGDNPIRFEFVAGYQHGAELKESGDDRYVNNRLIWDPGKALGHEIVVPETFTFRVIPYDRRNQPGQVKEWTVTVYPSSSSTNNVAPTIITSTLPDARSLANYSVSIGATDQNAEDLDRLTYHLVPTPDPITGELIAPPSWLLPTAAAANDFRNKGILTGRPGDLDVGTYRVTILVSDGRLKLDIDGSVIGSSNSTKTFDITVQPRLRINSPPVIATIAPRFLVPGDDLSIPITVFDADGSTFDYWLSDAPDGVELVQEKGKTFVKWTDVPEQEKGRPYVFSLHVSDKGEPIPRVDSAQITVYVTTKNHRPTVELSDLTYGGGLAIASLKVYDVDGVIQSPEPTHHVSIVAVYNADDGTLLSGPEVAAEDLPQLYRESSSVTTTATVGQSLDYKDDVTLRWAGSLPGAYLVVLAVDDGSHASNSVTNVIYTWTISEYLPPTIKTDSISTFKLNSSGTASFGHEFSITSQGAPLTSSDDVKVDDASKALGIQLIYDDLKKTWTLSWSQADQTIVPNDYPITISARAFEDGLYDFTSTYRFSLRVQGFREPSSEPESIEDVKIIDNSLAGFTKVGNEYTHQVAVNTSDMRGLTFAVVGAPAGFKISESGLIRWTPADSDPHLVTVQLIKAGTNTVLDERDFVLQGSESSSVQIGTSEVGMAQVGTSYTFDLPIDAPMGDVVLLQLNQEAIKAGATLVPIDTDENGKANGLDRLWRFSWTAAAPGTLPVEIVATNGDQRTDTIRYEIVAVASLGSGNNHKPSIGNPLPDLVPWTEGVAFDHALEVADVDDDSVSLIVSGAPEGMTPALIDDDLHLVWDEPEAGTYDITLRVQEVDDPTSFIERSFKLVVDLPANPYRPHLAPPASPRFATIGASNSYQLAALVDASPAPGTIKFIGLDDDPAIWGLGNAPRLKPDGTLTWTPTLADEGTRTFTVNFVYVDTASNRQVKGSGIVTIEAVENELPTFEPIVNYRVIAGSTLSQSVGAVDSGDPDGGVPDLTYEIVASSNPFPIAVTDASAFAVSSAGVITWTPGASYLTSLLPTRFTVKVRVSDGFGATQIQEVNVQVDPDVYASRVEIWLEQNGDRVSTGQVLDDATGLKVIVVDHHATSSMNDTFPLQLMNSDGDITNYYVGGDDAVVDGTGYRRLSYPIGSLPAAGNYLFAFDNDIPFFQNSPSPAVAIEAVDTDEFIVQANFESLIDDQVVSKPFDVTGNVAVVNADEETPDGVLQGVEVELSIDKLDAAGGVIAGTHQVLSTTSSPGPIEHGFLGRIDPTALSNGRYKVTLTGTSILDSTISVGVEREIEIKSENKLGNFAISFTDLQASLDGFALNVTRSYDSQRAGETDDFGAGWSFNLAEPKAVYEGVDESVDPTDEPSRGDRYTFTLLDGSQMQFEFQPYLDPNYSDAEAGIGFYFLPWFMPVVNFKGGVSRDLIGGLTGELHVLNESGEVVVGDDADNLPLLKPGAGSRFSYVDAPGSYAFDYVPIDVAMFELETSDGLKYHFNSQGKFLSVSDRAGHALKVTEPAEISGTGNEAIKFYAATDESASRSVTVVRDMMTKKIQAIQDFSGSSADSIVYTYDSDRLASVTDRADQITKYAYGDDPDNDLGLLTVIETGVGASDYIKVLTAVYDNYRLSSLIDGENNPADFTFDVDFGNGTSRERVKDQTSGSLTDLIRDTSGNLIRKVVKVNDEVYQVTVYEYDGNLLYRQSVPVEVPTNERYTFRPDPFTQSNWAVTNEYYLDINSDDAYDLGQNANGDRVGFIKLSSSDRGRFGKLASTTDASGFTTTYVYDDYGNTIRTVDSNGTETNNIYNTTGELLATYVVARYDVKSGRPRFTAPDALGQLLGLTDVQDTKTTLQSTIPGDFEVLSFNWFRYDDQGRLIATYDANHATDVSESSEDFPSSRQEYDLDTGQLIATFDSITPSNPTGNRRDFLYDASGNQEITFQVRSPSGSDPVTIATRNVYDANGRVTITQEFEVLNTEATRSDIRASLSAATPLRETRTFYDVRGRVETVIQRERDAAFDSTQLHNVSSTQTFYDVRGNVVETRTSSLNAGGAIVWLVTRSVFDQSGREIASQDAHVESLDGSSTTDLAAFFNISTPTVHSFGRGAIAALSSAGTKTVHDRLGRVSEVHRYGDVSIEFVDAENGYLKLAASDPITVSEPLSNEFSYYDVYGRVEFTVTTDEDGETGLITKFEYDAEGRQSATVQYLSGDFDPDAARVDPLTIVDPSTDVLRTEYSYDNAGRQIEVRDALGRILGTKYDALGRVVRSTSLLDGRPVVTDTTYDQVGNRVAETSPYDFLKVYNMNAADAAEFLLGITRNFEYNMSGRLTATVLPSVETADPDDVGETIVARTRYEYAYDAYGNMTELRDNILQNPDDPDDVDADHQRITAFTYNHRGQQLSRTLPNGTATTSVAHDFEETFAYDDFGRQVRHVDFEHRTTDFVYDQLGRLHQKQFFDGLTTAEPGKGTPNNLDATDALNEIDELVDYLYDAFGRTTRTIQDFDGTLSSTADQRIELDDYDVFGRLTRKESPEGAINYEYDNGTGKLVRTYTGDEQTGVDDDADGVAITDTRYQYDRLGRLQTVSTTARNDHLLTTPETTTYKYDLVGNLQLVITATGVFTLISEYEYDALNRLDRLTEYRDVDESGGRSTGDLLVASYDYDVDVSGRRTGAIEKIYDDAGALAQTNRIAWVYDSLNRLTAEYYDGQGIDHDFIDLYSFDLVGNRLEKRHDANPGFATGTKPVDLLKKVPTFDDGSGDETTTYEYDQNDRLLYELTKDDENENKVEIVYGYGPFNSGTHLTSKQTSNFSGGVDEWAIYEYDDRGRLSTVRIDEAADYVIEKRIDYLYDDAGDRVVVVETVAPEQEAETIERTRSLVDQNNPTGYSQELEVWKSLGSSLYELDRSYTLGHDVIGQWLANDGSGDPAAHVLLYDGHGSTRGLLDATGQPLENQVYAYDAYGNRIVGTGLFVATPLTTLLYSGEQTDVATGLQYLRARYYDPQSGRFTSLDPFAGDFNDPQSLHKYLYTHANPVNAIDPSGWESSLAGLSAAISNGLSLVNSAASFVGTAFTTVNTVLTSIDIVYALIDVATGGGLFQQVRSAVDQYIKHLSTSNSSSAALLFTQHFWSESGASFVRNIPRIGHSLLRSDTTKELFTRASSKIADPQYPRLVIQLPVPPLLPIPKVLVPLPLSIHLGPLNLGVTLQIGAAKKHTGRVLGFAIQTARDESSITQFLRQDFHDWHPYDSATGPFNDIRWPDNQGDLSFHYHVPL